MSKLQRWSEKGSSWKYCCRRGAVEVLEQQSGAVHVGRLTGLGKISDALGVWNLLGQGSLRAGRRLGDPSYPSSEVEEVLPSPGVGKLSVKDQRVNILSFEGHTVSVRTARLPLSDESSHR